MLKKGIKRRLVFISPIIIFMIGIIAHLIIIPYIYGDIIPLTIFFANDPKGIMDVLHILNNVSWQNHNITAVQIFWWIWLSGFSVSLFFVGKRLQHNEEECAIDALLTKKEPYLYLKAINNILNQLKANEKNPKLDSLINTMKRLEERFSIESDFGYGDNAVIDCENNIARQIGFLLDVVSHIKTDDYEADIEEMNKSVININALLDKRIELKRV